LSPFSFYQPVSPQALPSFPTRRSSDLDLRALQIEALEREVDARRDRQLAQVEAHEAQAVEAGLECILRIAHRHADAASEPEAHRSEEHTSELQSLTNLVCRLLLEKKKT